MKRSKAKGFNVEVWSGVRDLPVYKLYRLLWYVQSEKVKRFHTFGDLDEPFVEQGQSGRIGRSK